MNKEQAQEYFERYYLEPGEYDYWTVQEMWSAYVDSLCKDGQITQKQYDTWITPYPYGRTIKVSMEKKIRLKRKVGRY